MLRTNGPPRVLLANEVGPPDQGPVREGVWTERTDDDLCAAVCCIHVRTAVEARLTVAVGAGGSALGRLNGNGEEFSRKSPTPHPQETEGWAPKIVSRFASGSPALPRRSKL